MRRIGHTSATHSLSPPRKAFPQTCCLPVRLLVHRIFADWRIFSLSIWPTSSFCTKRWSKKKPMPRPRDFGRTSSFNFLPDASRAIARTEPERLQNRPRSKDVMAVTRPSRSGTQGIDLYWRCFPAMMGGFQSGPFGGASFLTRSCNTLLFFWLLYIAGSFGGVCFLCERRMRMGS